MGETCVIQYDACTPELQNCKNNATCTTTPPSRDFHCECVPGFSGSDCWQNIDDCAQHNCSYPERCYDVINGFYCACPIGECMAGLIQGSLRPEKYLNLEDYLEKSLKIKSANKVLEKSLKSLENSLNSILFSVGPTLLIET